MCSCVQLLLVCYAIKLQTYIAGAHRLVQGAEQDGDHLALLVMLVHGQGNSSLDSPVVQLGLVGILQMAVGDSVRMVCCLSVLV